MSTLYTDEIETSFPGSVDNFDRFIDPDLSMLSDIQKYYTYMNAGNTEQAAAVLAGNEKLQRCVMNASNMNKLRDAIIAVEKFYMDDVQQYLVNIVVYKGTWVLTSTYSKYNVVNYTNTDGVTLSYMAIQDTPTGTYPTNTQYWVALTLRGAKGDSGTGLAPRGTYDVSTTYNTDDFVIYNNTWYVCSQDNVVGQQPDAGSIYWWVLLQLDSSILTYDNSRSGLSATTMQAAIDELADDASAGVKDITHGGTGASNADDARTNLGVAYGTTAGTVCQGNDSRLSDARTPLSHTHTPSEVGLSEVGNFKAVSTVANQGLTEAEKANARTNIGAGDSSFSGDYNALQNKPTLGTAAAKAVDTSIDASSTSVNLPTSQAVATFVEGKGYKTTDNNTTYTVETGDSNGQIKVTPSDGSAYNVPVKGLGSAAYTESSAYAASSHTQAASTVTAGTFAGDVVAPASTSYTTKTLRNTMLIASDSSAVPEAGGTASASDNGSIIFVYEA